MACELDMLCEGGFEACIDSVEYVQCFYREWKAISSAFHLNSYHSSQWEIKSRLKSGNACYHSVRNILSSSLLLKI